MKRYKPVQRYPRTDLSEIVTTHLQADWRRPIAAHSIAAFDTIRDRIEASTQPLIIDSCCGTGDSTRHLAGAFPDSLVLGVDKSAHRLARHRMGEQGDYLMLRADVNDFWRLAVDAGWRPARHYLLYPNPYPKATQIRKRWYASPAFPALLGLGGILTVRANWKLYIEEFVHALGVAGFTATMQKLAAESPITGFESKYLERGNELFEMVCDLEIVSDGLGKLR
jgi:tRNA G46 methylase TrmB